MPGDHQYETEITNGVKVMRRAPHHIPGIKAYLGTTSEVVQSAVNGFFENTGFHNK